MVEVDRVDPSTCECPFRRRSGEDRRRRQLVAQDKSELDASFASVAQGKARCKMQEQSKRE